MQILKEAIRARMLAAARDEFLAKGFRHASLRGIAKRSGVTAGNLYKYFRNKQTLFAKTVGPAHEELLKLFSHHDHATGFREDMLNAAMVRKLMEMVSGVFAKHRKEFLILIDGSGGTRFKRARYEYSMLAEKNLLHHLRGDRSLSHVVSIGFIEGICEIVRQNDDPKAISDLIFNYFMFFISGILGNPL